MSKGEYPYQDRWRARLRQAVARSGKKHAAIAWDAGIAPETLSRILNGHMARPGFDIIVAIIHASGETVGWVLAEHGYGLSEEERANLREAAAIIIEATSVGRLLRSTAETEEKRRTR